MKKLMTMLAAVGMAFGLFAADPDPIVDTNDFASVTQEAFSNDTQWTYNGAATKPIDKVWVANNLLNLATGSDKVSRTFVPGSAATITDAIYLDANINFEDPFDEPPVISDSDNAKVAAFVLDNSGIIEELGDAAKVAASTNLYVIAGYYNSETTEWEKRAFMFATPAAEGIADKFPKRLTIKAYGDVMDDATTTRVGFRFFLNGNTAIKEALAVRYVFPINDDGSIDFTTFIDARDTTTPYLGEGVKASLKAAVRSRCSDQTLVLALEESAAELLGFDLAGKGELANFTLTTESPTFIDGDSQTVTLALTDAQVTVTGAVDYDQTSITFAPGDPITVSATYTEGKSDIVKWTLNEVEIQPTNDSYTWKPNNNDVLAISAKAAAAFVEVNGVVTPYETFDAALTAVCETGGTLKLAGSYTEETQAITIASQKEVIIDLAGKTLTGNGGILGSVFNMGNLTITNSVGEGHIAGTISIVNAGTLKIAEGVMDGVVQTGFSGDTDLPGTTSIIGGTFDGNVTVVLESSALTTVGGLFNKEVFTDETAIPGVDDKVYDVIDNKNGYWKVIEHVADTFTVTFKVDGADYDTVDVRENETVGKNMPANPTKTGYTFQKWVIGETETEFTATTVVTANMTVNAKFTVDTYTITIAEGGESASATPNTYTIESFDSDADLEVTLDAGTAPANKKFVSWTKNVDDTVATIAGNTLTIKNGKLANITVRAVWTEKAQPIDPGKEIPYDTPSMATNAASVINANKETNIRVPDVVPTEGKQAYLNRVAAKVVGSSVVVDIAADKEATFKTELDTEMKKDTVAAALTDASATTASITTVAGFYYWVEGGVEVGTINQNGAAKIGTGSTIELAKPALGTTDKAFYKLAVGVKDPAK